MALTKRNDQDFVGTAIADISGASDSLVSLSQAASNYALEGIDAKTGNIYKAFNNNVRQQKDCLTLYFDFDTDGGAIGTINLRGGALPDNAIIDRAWYEVTTTFTSATDAATIALGVETDDATGIVAATAISGMGNIWDAGNHAAIDPSTVADYTTKSTAAGRNIVATIATEAVTAGALVLHVEYRVSEAQ